MADERMTLIEKLRNPAWEAFTPPDPRGCGQTPARLNIEQTVAAMTEAANAIERQRAALKCAKDYISYQPQNEVTANILAIIDGVLTMPDYVP